MESTTLGLANAQSAGIGVQAPESNQSSGFEIEVPGRATRRFESAEAVREAILCGEIPRTASIRKMGGTSVGKPVAVDLWAKSNGKLRSLYTPVWSLTLKGAWIGFLVVAALKALDTLFLLFSVNPSAAILWLLIGAAMFSPKWKVQIIVAAFIVGSKAGINPFTLFGAWTGVLVFAAVFGISAGMAVGTIAGYLRAWGARTAPDAQGEGLKPVIWGLAVPGMAFLIAAVVYVQVLLPAALRLIQG